MPHTLVTVTGLSSMLNSADLLHLPLHTQGACVRGSDRAGRGQCYKSPGLPECGGGPVSRGAHPMGPGRGRHKVTGHPGRPPRHSPECYCWDATSSTGFWTPKAVMKMLTTTMMKTRPVARLLRKSSLACLAGLLRSYLTVGKRVWTLPGCPHGARLCPLQCPVDHGWPRALGGRELVSWPDPHLGGQGRCGDRAPVWSLQTNIRSRGYVVSPQSRSDRSVHGVFPPPPLGGGRTRPWGSLWGPQPGITAK